MIILLILIVLVIAFVVTNVVSKKNLTRSIKGIKTSTQNQQYTTILRIQPSLASGTVGCKDGIVYKPSSSTTHELGAVIGSYKPESIELGNTEWTVYDDKQYEIGRVYKSSTGDFHIYLTLHGMVLQQPHLRTKAFNSPNGYNWIAAEAVELTKAIIDHDSYAPLGFYEGNPAEAAAAFICWAHEGDGNKYSDYFRL